MTTLVRSSARVFFLIALLFSVNVHGMRTNDIHIPEFPPPYPMPSSLPIGSSNVFFKYIATNVLSNIGVSVGWYDSNGKWGTVTPYAVTAYLDDLQEFIDFVPDYGMHLVGALKRLNYVKDDYRMTFDACLSKEFITYGLSSFVLTTNVLMRDVTRNTFINMPKDISSLLIRVDGLQKFEVRVEKKASLFYEEGHYSTFYHYTWLRGMKPSQGDWVAQTLDRLPREQTRDQVVGLNEWYSTCSYPSPTNYYSVRISITDTNETRVFDEQGRWIKDQIFITPSRLIGVRSSMIKTFQIETSSDLKNWEPLSKVKLNLIWTPMNDKQRFYRFKQTD